MPTWPGSAADDRRENEGLAAARQEVAASRSKSSDHADGLPSFVTSMRSRESFQTLAA
jgi:hypothetical protein